MSTRSSVDAFNRVAEVRQVRLQCPETVAEGAKEMECTLHGTRTGKTANVRMEAIRQEDDFIDAVDGTAFKNAVEQVSRP